MKKILGFIAPIITGLILLAQPAAALGPYAPGSTGVDISWPNCSSSVPTSAFGIVGVTGGTAYSYNKCLTTETSHFSNLSLYVNTGWYNQSSHLNATSPKVCASGDQVCLAYNYGYNAGLDALNYATSQNVTSASWWLDAETSNTWNASTAQNQASLQGEYDALKAGGVATIGAYSTTAQWQSITAGWKNAWPNWGATTWTTAKQAQSYCTGHQFTGGPSYLMQYTPQKSKIDQDVAC